MSDKITKELVNKYAELSKYELVEFGEKYTKFKMPSGKVVPRSFKDLTNYIEYKNKAVAEKNNKDSHTPAVIAKKLKLNKPTKDLTEPLNVRIRGSLIPKLQRFAKDNNLSISKVIDKLVDECI